MRCDLINGWLTWTDRSDTKKILFDFRLDSVHPELVAKVYEYGLRKCIADAGASAIDRQERIRMMGDRAAALMDGSYGTRAPLPDGDIFRAMVVVRGLTDNPELRAKWKALDAKQRRAIGDRPDVRAKMETVPVADTDDLLDSMMD